MEEKYLKIRKIVEKELSCSAHGIDHVMRVYNLSLSLSKEEADIDLDILIPAVLLHDIARVKEDQDPSGNINHAILSSEMSENILKELNFPEKKIEAIKHCIISHRFRGDNEPKTKEARILFDADKLDILGAIGIARSFIIAGQHNEKIYSDIDIDEYIKDNLTGGNMGGKIKQMSKHAPNLEYQTKFKRILDKLFTEKAKEIAKERMEFMNLFFERLKREIDGEI